MAAPEQQAMVPPAEPPPEAAGADAAAGPAAEPAEKPKFNAKEFFIGNYDWGFLCMPRLPCGAARPPPPFFEKDEKISMFVAFMMGAQHCIAMVGGIITVPYIVSGPGVGNFPDSGRQYLISAALIVSGIATAIQVTQFRIPFTRYVIGSGLLSVMGVSFTFLPICQSAMPTMMACTCNGAKCMTGMPYSAGGCDGCPGTIEGSCNTGEEAYGKILGTILVACWLEVFIAFIPLNILRRIFPPVVTGTTVLLIGLALTGAGIQQWGGGAYCASQVLTSQVPCQAGETQLLFGSPQYVGLGFVVFFTLIIVEMFGSPFMRNISVALGLLVGMIVASATSYTSCTDSLCQKQCYSVLPPGMSFNNQTNTVTGTPNSTFPTPPSICQEACIPVPETCVTQRYVTGKQIQEANWITFLWVNTYPLGFYAPVLLPMLFGILVTAMECIGDVTATTEASGLIPAGEDFERAVQGGLLADGLNIFWGALATTLPCVTYAENNGVVSLTRCAARRAGLFCAGLLVLLGVIQKFAGVILTIPEPVLGGMTSFLFANVAVSGMRILTMDGGINRRNRFICAMALTLGIGVALIPPWINIAGQDAFPLQGHFWPINPSWSAGMTGFRDGIIIMMTNGFSFGGFTALLLNLIIPFEADDEDEFGLEDSHVKTKMAAFHDAVPQPQLSEQERAEIEMKQHGHVPA